MAVNSYLKRKTGSMRFRTGTDTKGNSVYRTVSISNIKHEATDDDIAEVLIAINGLMDPSYKAQEINKDEKYQLYKEF